MKRREDLSTPRTSRRVGVQYDPDTFGAFSESIASFLGTARFLVWQTGVIALWIGYNTLAPDQYQFDPWSRGLVLLTLVLSVQASYAAPLILLSQNRQEVRDRSTSETDREVAERTQAQTEFLAREIASVRHSLADMVTGETLDDRLENLTKVIERLSVQVEGLTSSSVTSESQSQASDQDVTASTSSTVNDAN